MATLNVFATPFNPLTQICSLTVTFNGVGGDVLYPTVCASIGSAVDSMSLCHDLPSLLIGISVEIVEFSIVFNIEKMGKIGKNWVNIKVKGSSSGDNCDGGRYI